jgi:hypothetical protein
MADATPETAASRYDRDWAHILDTRKRRGLDYQAPERTAREYVAPNGSTPADNDNKFGDPYTDED